MLLPSRRIWLALALAATAAAARGGDLRDFCADRPGKATPACILDQGRLQAETALADAVFQRGGGFREETYAVGATELRFGLSRPAEAELAWTPLIVDHVRGAARRTGIGDASLGLRAALTDPDAKDAPQVSAQGFVSAPTATHGLGAGGWGGGLRLPVALTAAGLGLGFTPEADVARNASGHGLHAVVSAVAAASRGFGATTLGVELWGQLDRDPGGHVRQASLDLTGARALGSSGQVDAGVNLGLNRDTPNAEVYVGIARRF